MIPHVISPTLPKFYKVAPHLPQIGAAVSTWLSEHQKKNLDKDSKSTVPLFDHDLAVFPQGHGPGKQFADSHLDNEEVQDVKGSSKEVRARITSIFPVRKRYMRNCHSLLLKLYAHEAK